MESDYIPRQSQDQPWINRLAKHYLTAQETSLLCKFLNCTPEHIRLDEKEHKMLSRNYPEFFHPGRPTALNALYLYVFGIDEYLRQVRQLWFTVQNLQDLDAKKQDLLDHEILAPDFRLWPVVDSNNPTSLPGRTYQDDKGLHAKDNKAAAYDEMCLLYFPCISLLTCLAQGLFRATARDQWLNYPNQGGNQNVQTIKKALEAGVRRPDLYESLCYFPEPLKGQLKSFFGNVSILRAREPELGDQMSGPRQGGAIGYYDIYITQQGAVQDVKRIDWATIAHNMKLLRGSWYEFCPRLSDALLNSRVNQDLNSMYNSLQNFYDQKRKVSTIGMEPRNPQDIIQFRNRLSGYQNLFGCGPGMVPRFVSHSGKEVPLRDAVLEHNGMQYINTAIVDPDQSSCTAVIPLKQANQFAALLK